MRATLPLLMLVLCCPLLAAENYSHEQDIVYGRKHGTALTLDVFTPAKNANGAAVLWMVSGGWFSSHDAIRPQFAAPFLERGYTVFAVVHGSQPRFTIPEAIADVQRAVRFVRHNAKRFKIDPERIGVMGASAGGHLTLSLATRGDGGNPNAGNDVDRVSSRVQAAACFFPPTDFLNYGKPGEEALGNGVLDGFRAPFDFHEFSQQTKKFERITDAGRRRKIGEEISPFYHISAGDAPALIIHGDADKLVPIQQAQIFVDKYKETGLTGELVVKPGAAHGWPTLLGDLKTFADWFDKHLAKQP